jgi:hypothetical protein
MWKNTEETTQQNWQYEDDIFALYHDSVEYSIEADR